MQEEWNGASLLAEGHSSCRLDICEAKGTEQRSCEVTKRESQGKSTAMQGLNILKEMSACM